MGALQTIRAHNVARRVGVFALGAGSALLLSFLVVEVSGSAQVTGRATLLKLVLTLTAILTIHRSILSSELTSRAVRAFSRAPLRELADKTVVTG
jgi:hypothetical protein